MKTTIATSDKRSMPLHDDIWTLVLSQVDFDAPEYSHRAALTVSKQWHRVLHGIIYEVHWRTAGRMGLEAFMQYLRPNWWGLVCTHFKIHDWALRCVCSKFDRNAWKAASAEAGLMTPEFINDHAMLVCWKRLLKVYQLPEWLLAAHLDMMQKHRFLLSLQDISAEFISAHADKLDLVAVYINDKPTLPGFWEEHADVIAHSERTISKLGRFLAALGVMLELEDIQLDIDDDSDVDADAATGVALIDDPSADEHV